MPGTLESATRGPLLPLTWVPYSFFAVGMVAAGAGGKRRSKFGTTSALLSMSLHTPSIAPTTVAVAKVGRVVNDVKLAIVARRVRRPVGDSRFVAVAGAQGTGFAVRH